MTLEPQWSHQKRHDPNCPLWPNSKKKKKKKDWRVPHFSWHRRQLLPFPPNLLNHFFFFSVLDIVDCILLIHLENWFWLTNSALNFDRIRFCRETFGSRWRALCWNSIRLRLCLSLPWGFLEKVLKLNCNVILWIYSSVIVWHLLQVLSFFKDLHNDHLQVSKIVLR